MRFTYRSQKMLLNYGVVQLNDLSSTFKVVGAIFP